jgi:dolichol-phosphate hexosyltransferase
MEKETKKITVIIPCYNEERGVGSVISGFKTAFLENSNYDFEIIVIDNNSKDKTTEVAKTAGATVLFEGKKGKGNAVRKGFANVSSDTDFVVMIDGDDTYRPVELFRLIELLESDFCSVVLGSRLYGKISEGSMKSLNLLGNKMFTLLSRVFYGVQSTDVLTGYYAWKKSAVDNMLPHLNSDGFTIEIEMVTKMAKLGETIFSVPISYDARAGESNLKPVSDGIKIMRVLLANLFWKSRINNVEIDEMESDEFLPQGA